MTEVKPQYEKKEDTKKIIQNSNMERKNVCSFEQTISRRQLDRKSSFRLLHNPIQEYKIILL